MPTKKETTTAKQPNFAKPPTQRKRGGKDDAEVKQRDYFLVDPSTPVYDAARKKIFQVLIQEHEENLSGDFGETDARDNDGYYKGKLRNPAKYWESAKLIEQRYNRAIDMAVFEQVADWIARALGEAVLAGAKAQAEHGNVEAISESAELISLYYDTLEKMAWALDKVGTEPYLTAKHDPNWREKNIGERQITRGKVSNRTLSAEVKKRNAEMLKDFERRKSAEPHLTKDEIFERMSLGGKFTKCGDGRNADSLTPGTIKNILKGSVRKER